MMQTLVVEDPLADLARLDGVPSAVVSARDAVDAVLRDRGLRQIPAEASAAALLTGARATVELESDTDPDSARWLPGAVRLSTELIELSALARTAPAQLLARAHALLAHGVVDDADLGRVRTGPEGAARLAGLNLLLTRPTGASAVIAGAIAHAEVASVRPFGGGDGIVARALEHMILIVGGVDPRAAIVVEAGHLASRQSYAANLNGYGTGSATGVRDWIIACSRALAHGAEVSPLVSR